MLAIHVSFVTLSLVGFFFYAFAIADRYEIFLYGHQGAIPFDARTISRYWMTGLVANGYLLLSYTALNWFAGRVFGIFNRYYNPPEWRKIWQWSALPGGAGIVWVTTTFNQPTLPFSIALICAVIALLALVPVLITGTFASHHLKRIIAWSVAGWGLVPALLLFRLIELPTLVIAKANLIYPVAIGSTFLGALWVLASVWILRQRQMAETAWQIFVAGLSWSYLILPLAHHLFLTPSDYHYISVVDNFFAQTAIVQIESWAIAIFIIGLVNRWPNTLRNPGES